MAVEGAGNSGEAAGDQPCDVTHALRTDAKGQRRCLVVTHGAHHQAVAAVLVEPGRQDEEAGEDEAKRDVGCPRHAVEGLVSARKIPCCGQNRIYDDEKTQRGDGGGGAVEAVIGTPDSAASAKPARSTKASANGTASS